MHPACATCGRRFQREQGSTVGVMQIGSMATLVFGSALWHLVDALTGWSLPLSIGASIALTVAFGLGLFPYFALLWEAVDYLIDINNYQDSN
jgi:hypothetical protein